MTRAVDSFRLYCISLLSLGVIACAGTPEKDDRPALIVSAEKSLELGVENYLENNFAKAETHFNRALFLYRNIDHPEGIVSSCLNIAKARLSYGQVDAAMPFVTQAQKIIRQENLDHFNDRLVLIQSSIAIEQHDYSSGRKLSEQLLQTSASSNNHAIRTAALQNRTRIAFLDDENSADSWLTQYRAALKQPGQNTALNRARLLRFEAALNTKNAKDKYTRALALYRTSAHGPGIAATLSEWSAHDIDNAAYVDAIDKLQRALFIRSNLYDRVNCEKIMSLLHDAYRQSGLVADSERSAYWLNQLNARDFNQWEALEKTFNAYPE